MILGFGTDIVDLKAFQQQLNDPASTFIEHSFTSDEIYDATHRPGHNPTQHFGARYAAKESLIKAWSAAIWGQPPSLPRVDMREIEVICDRYNRPTLALHGTVQNAIQVIAPFRIHLSMSHDSDFATASVILERPLHTTLLQPRS